MDKVVDMKQKKQRPVIIGGFTVGAMIAIVALAIFGFSKTITEINEIAMSETPEAILANAGINNVDEVIVPVAYFDQKMDECVNLYDNSLRSALLVRQFEWTSCGYDRQGMEQGLVDFYLGEDGLPVGLGGRLTANRGVDDMSRWFDAVKNKSKKYPGTLALRYVAKELKFSYENEEFYPLDDVDFSNDDPINNDGHNHLFTMNLAVPFSVLGNGKETFTIEADDDTFVFIDDRLAIDMGGIHVATGGEIWISEDGEVYTNMMDGERAFAGIKLELGENAVIRVFHADRDTNGSVFKMNLYGIEPKVINTQIADKNGVQVAYDPSDPMHTAPLGVSTILRLDSKKSYMVIATIYGVVIVVVVLGIAFLTRYLLRVQR